MRTSSPHTSVRFDLTVGGVQRGGITFDSADAQPIIETLLNLIELDQATVTVRKSAPGAAVSRFGQQQQPSHADPPGPGRRGRRSGP